MQLFLEYNSIHGFQQIEIEKVRKTFIAHHFIYVGDKMVNK